MSVSVTRDVPAPDPARVSERGSGDDLATLAKAVGNPARVRILRLLLERSTCYCGEIVDELPLAQATVSQHLKVLRDAGLIQGEIEGARVCYWANPERLVDLRDQVDVLLSEAVERSGDRRGCD